MIYEDLHHDMVNFYGEGTDGTSPRPVQWARVLKRDPDRPLTLVNFFKFRTIADYGRPDETVTGKEAFERYAEISIPTMKRVGGSFLLVAPFETTFIGPEETWDLIAVGSYPNQKAFLDLYQDAGYREAFRHRTAACEHQKVFLAAA